MTKMIKEEGKNREEKRTDKRKTKTKRGKEEREAHETEEEERGRRFSNRKSYFGSHVRLNMHAQIAVSHELCALRIPDTILLGQVA